MARTQARARGQRPTQQMAGPSRDPSQTHLNNLDDLEQAADRVIRQVDTVRTFQ